MFWPPMLEEELVSRFNNHISFSLRIGKFRLSLDFVTRNKFSSVEIIEEIFSFLTTFTLVREWIRLLVRMLIGMVTYFTYSVKKSILGNGTGERSGMQVALRSGIVLSVLLIIVGLLHPQIDGFQTDRTLHHVAVAFAVTTPASSFVSYFISNSSITFYEFAPFIR